MLKKVIRFIGAALLLSILTAGVAFAAGKDVIKIVVNGQEIKPAIHPQIVNGTVLLPVRAIAESLGAEVKWDEQTSSVIITTKVKTAQTVASNNGEEIVLSAIEKEGMYEDFTLQARGSKRYFDWKNVSNPTCAPELVLSDIDHDGLKELIVVLTTATGTGVHITEAHVIEPDTLAETYIDNPVAIILKNVKTEITEGQIAITIGDRKTVIDTKGINIDAGNLFPEVAFNNICEYEVVNNELRVNLGAQISPAHFIGEVQISYGFKDNMYQARKIEFIPDSTGDDPVEIEWQELVSKYNPPAIGDLLQAIKNSNRAEDGKITITPAIKRQFNQMGEDYLFFFMPQVSWYDFGPAVYDPTGEALSYILFTWAHDFGEFQEVPKYEAEARLRKIFAAPNDVYPPLKHQEYGKCVMFDGEVYTPWPESYNANAMIYHLTQLRATQDGDYTYYTATADEYQFDARGYYEPGENEKFLAARAEDLGLDYDAALARLLETGDIAAANKSKTYTIEFRIKGDDITPQIVSVRKVY